MENNALEKTVLKEDGKQPFNRPSSPKKVMTMRARRNQTRIFLISLLIVPIVHWLVSWVYINGSTIALAFQDRRGEFTFENFSEVKEMLFNPDRNISLVLALKNTVLTFCCMEFIGVPISLVVSYFIYKQIKGYKTFRFLFYLPSIIPAIVYVTAQKQFVSSLGPLAALCNQWGIAFPEEGLLMTPDTATWTIIFFSLWTGACGNILFYSAMSRVPPEMVEVGRLEGITLRQELIYIIIPIIWPTFSTTVILDMTNILSAGGPVLLYGASDVIARGKTITIPYWFFSQVYDNGAYGIGSYGIMSAVGLVFTSICLPLTLFVRWCLNKVNTAEV